MGEVGEKSSKGVWMVELFEQKLKTSEYQSSKGNQLKWFDEDIWYKADYLGYEGLTEYMVSHLLQYSTLQADEYVIYETEQIKYKSQILRGCRSKNFLSTESQLITLERLYKQHFGTGFYVSTFQIPKVRDRAEYVVSQVERITGISDFGKYLEKLLVIDAVFLNEDRHMHNIAVRLDADGKYAPSVIFDHGAGLLSDTAVDYPMGEDIYAQIDEVNAKTLSSDFDLQLDAVESLFGSNLKFSFSHRDVEKLLDQEPYYDAQVKNRVRDIIFDRMRKYSYLWV